MKLCTVEGCGRPYSCRGLCKMHYARVQRGGEVGPPGMIVRRAYGRDPDRWICDCPPGTPTETCGPLFPDARQCARCKRPRSRFAA